MTTIDFRAVLEASPNAYMVVDRALCFVWANAAYLRATGATLDELVGRAVFDVFPHDPSDPANDSARLLRTSFERVLTTGERDVLAVIRYAIPRDGPQGTTLEERVWSATHTPLVGSDGKVSHVLQHTVDVTDLHRDRLSLPGDRDEQSPASARVQMEADVLGRAERVQEANVLLDAERRRLLVLFDQAPGFMCFMRRSDHVIELANRALHDFVGRRDLVDRPLREAIPEIAGQGYLERLDEVFTTGEPFVGRGLRMVLARRPGQPPDEAFVDIVLQPIRDASGEVTGIFVQGVDITAQRRQEAERAALLVREQAARAEAERANRVKDDFLAIVSHELRSPLNAMLGWLTMLREGRLPEDRRDRALETVERNARAQSKLIGDLLDVSRIISGKLELQMDEVDVAEIAETVVESMRPGADAQGIRIVMSCDGEARVSADPRRLEQIVGNLLSNALKFTPRGGLVTVTVGCDGGSAVLDVTDTGQGIAREFLPHVFERFQQEQAGSARSHGGLGLGLAIVHQLVEQHGGAVVAESEGVGKGARFTVRLPLVASARAGRQVDGSDARPSRITPVLDLAGATLLVVEDEMDSRELLAAILEQRGATVHVASSVASGLALVQRVRPDVVLSDIGMPGEDGYALAQRVRVLPRDEGGGVPMLALTAFARAEDRARALDAGFAGHVAKPIDTEELISVLVPLLRRERRSTAG